MKSNKSKSIVFVFLHVVAALVIMIFAQFCGDIASNILTTGNVAVDNLIFTVIYVGITLLIGLLYAKYILHFKFEEIGVCLKRPQLKWILVGIYLPLAVTAFYLIFTSGRIVKNENAENISFYLIKAIFPIGAAAGICEEFIFRGIIMRILERKWNITVAIIVPSVLFAVIHMVNMNLGFIDILLLTAAGAAVGIMFSLIAYQSGTIWSGAIVHALWNAIIIGGVFIIESPANSLTANFFCRYELLNDSVFLTGGRFGIEAALPAIIGYCLVSVIAFILLKKRSKK